MLDKIRNELIRLSNPENARFLQRYFKTEPGEYGDGDLFRGIRVPVLRKLSLAARGLALQETLLLLGSGFHEDRLLALLILVQKFAVSDEAGKRRIYELYLNSTSLINNWDLVDTSAAQIVGAYLYDRDQEPLLRLAHSSNIWERRISVMATFHFIKRGSFEATMSISALLLADREPLIQKAVGWMLREVGKRDPQRAELFLQTHHDLMPRTMLRYAIERFPEEKRQAYLKGKLSPDKKAKEKTEPAE